MSVDIEFSRHYLVEVHKDVKRTGLEGNLWKLAWVWRGGRDFYEFHGPGKYHTSFRATNGYEARAKGWQEFIKARYPELHEQLEKEAMEVDSQGPRV